MRPVRTIEADGRTRIPDRAPKDIERLGSAPARVWLPEPLTLGRK